MKSRSLSRSALVGGVGVFLLILAGCKSNPPPEDVWTLIDRGEGLQAREFFLSRARIDDTDRRGRTPLHAAAEAEDDTLTAFLIALGAKPDELDKQNRTPLTICAEKWVIAAKERVAAAGKNDTAAEARAAAEEKGVASTARMLVRAGADIHRPMPAGKTPALIALDQGDPASDEFLDAILTSDSIQSTDKDGRTILHLEVVKGKEGRGGNLEIIEKILKRNGSVLMKADDGGKSALDIALEQTVSLRHAEIAEYLIQQEARSPNPLYRYFSPAVLQANYNYRFLDGSTPLHYTAQKGYTGFSELLLNRDADPLAKNTSGATPLHEAVRAGSMESIGLLLDRGADINAQDAKGNAPLHIAAPPEVHQGVLELLLSQDADPNLRDEHGETPLHIAILLGRQPEVVDTLIKGGSNLSIRNIDGKTPLYLAVEERRIDLIPSLLSSDIFAADNAGITPLEKALKDTAVLSALVNSETVLRSDSAGNTILHIAILKQAEPKAVGLILEAKPFVDSRNKEGDTGLHLAVRQNDQNAQAAGGLLLENGADIFASNARGESPLYLGFHSPGGRRDWLFTEHALNGRDGNRDGLGNSILHYAAQWKLDSDIRWLIKEKGVSSEVVNANGETPLYMAVKADSPSTIQVLLNEGARMGARDKLGNTALHAAVRWNAKKAAEKLLASGLDPNIRALNGRAPLHDAVQLGVVDLEKVLISYRANVEIRDNEGNTPLMDAVKGRSSDAAERLIDSYRADPFTSNVQGQTPLHIAVINEQDGLIRLLMSKGASIHMKDAQGKSPFQLALNLRSGPESSLRIVPLLLTRDWVSTADDQGSSPLHIAITEGVSLYMVKRIIDLGARLSAIDAKGFTPLRLAIDKNDLLLSRLLAEAGSDVFFRAGDERNPAEIALARGKEAVEALFFDKTINARDSSGNTILHYAARLGDTAMISFLLERGAESVKNIAEESPEDVARRWKRDRAADLLHEAAETAKLLSASRRP